MGHWKDFTGSVAAGERDGEVVDISVAGGSPTWELIKEAGEKRIRNGRFRCGAWAVDKRVRKGFVCDGCGM